MLHVIHVYGDGIQVKESHTISFQKYKTNYRLWGTLLYLCGNLASPNSTNLYLVYSVYNFEFSHMGLWQAKGNSGICKQGPMLAIQTK